MREDGTIISPDTKRANRVPPGQSLTDGWPTLQYGGVRKIDPSEWKLTISGLVDEERSFTLSEFMSLPMVKVFSDIHCVTSWSKLDNLWEGVSTSALKDLVKILPEARFAIIHAPGNFTTMYFWKSAKWITGIEFTRDDRPGFWESHGYHNHGDPWAEERYS